jgi:hypothetical protein
MITGQTPTYICTFLLSQKEANLQMVHAMRDKDENDRFTLEEKDGCVVHFIFA